MARHLWNGYSGSPHSPAGFDSATIRTMRDDFAASVKDELAKRVGFGCSNPACRQATSGPQEGPAGTVNVGVAAHITSASAGGPRYNPDLTPEQRSAASNGIWLCQVCAKLIDDDVQRYTEDKLFEWRSDAETAARRALEQRKSPPTASGGVFLEAQRLMPELLDEMRTDVRGDETELVREFVVLSVPTIAYGWPRGHFVYTEETHPTLQSQLAWLEDAGFIVGISNDPGFGFRIMPEFYRWLQSA